MAGRPKDNSHPAKSKKLESQRNLQRISKESEANEAMKNHSDLMEVHRNDISNVLIRIFWKDLEPTQKFCVMKIKKIQNYTIRCFTVCVSRIMK